MTSHFIRLEIFFSQQWTEGAGNHRDLFVTCQKRITSQTLNTQHTIDNYTPENTPGETACVRQAGRDDGEGL